MELNLGDTYGRRGNICTLEVVNGSCSLVSGRVILVKNNVTDAVPWTLAIQKLESLRQTNFAISFTGNCYTVF